MKQFFVDQYNDEYRSQIVRLLDVKQQPSKVEADDDKVDLSSKSIRDKIKNKQSLEGLVPKQVIDKIKEIINNG